MSQLFLSARGFSLGYIEGGRRDESGVEAQSSSYLNWTSRDGSHAVYLADVIFLLSHSLPWQLISCQGSPSSRSSDQAFFFFFLP